MLRLQSSIQNCGNL
uniref:Uncharacterized protein n=1 Tax=Rhizophora mucronata TaxID=61149 RepID=A0A2P2NFR9_RHIMU